MKKEDASTKNRIIWTVLLFPVVLLFLFWFLIITPLDYIHYKQTRYYRDTKDKYSWLCNSSYYIKLYDLIKKENLPIDYYRCNYAPITGYGFFIYKDILILNNYEPRYDAVKNIWLVENEDEYVDIYVDIKEDVENAIDECNLFLKKDVCKKAVVFIDKDLFQEHPDVKYEIISFLPASDCFDIEAMKALIKYR